VVDMPGSAGLVMVSGVVHMDPEAAVFEAMLTGWARQQRSRLLGEKTIADRLRLVRRFADFAESYPVDVGAWGCGGLHGVVDFGARSAVPVNDSGVPLVVADVR